jgi:hypothetical protein
MRGPLDIDADLAIRAGEESISVFASGRGVTVDTTSLAVFRQLPSHYRGLGNLRKLGAGLARADQAVTVSRRGVPILELDPARRRRWLGWLLRVPGFRFHLFNWLRHRR